MDPSPEQDLAEVSAQLIELIEVPIPTAPKRDPSPRSADTPNSNSIPRTPVDETALPTTTTHPPPTNGISPDQAATVSIPAAGAGATDGTYPNRASGPGVFSHTGSTSTFTFSPLIPLTSFWLRGMRYVATNVLGLSAASVKLAFVRCLFFFDNINPIAWGKLLTWFFHPGRYTQRSRKRGGLQVLIRLMFLLTGFFTVFVQYSGLLLTPADKFQNSFIGDVMSDPISDGIKYSGFTNRILQTLLLHRPQGDFGRGLVSSSRLYMNDVCFGTCLCAVAIVFIVEGSPWIKGGYILYTIILWLDFTLKRLKPQNFVRRKISVLANEVCNNTHRLDLGAGGIRAASPADTGFPMREKRASDLYYYAIYFLTNAILRTTVYGPLSLAMAARFSA